MQGVGGLDRVRRGLFPFLRSQRHIGWRYLFVDVRFNNNVAINSLFFSLRFIQRQAHSHELLDAAELGSFCSNLAGG